MTKSKSIDPFIPCHVPGTVMLPSGTYDLVADKATFFELIVPGQAVFCTFVKSFGSPHRVRLPELTTINVEIDEGATWFVRPVQVHEDLDTKPLEVPLGVNKPLTLREELMRFMKDQLFLQRLGLQDKFESFEESDDLDVEELPDFAFEKSARKYEVKDDSDMPPPRAGNPDKSPSGEKKKSDTPDPKPDADKPVPTGS